MNLSAPQNVFLNGLNNKYNAYVGGFGSGKTFVGCLDLLIFFGRYPGTRQGYFSISYPSIRDVFYPTFEEAADLMGFSTVTRVGDREVDVYRNGSYYGTVICRSMDNPGTIVGFKIARAMVDEIDVLPTEKANNAWNKIIARMRLKIDGVVNGINVTTTPEGFKFVYSKFKENPSDRYSMVQASTYENEAFLPEDYIDSLKESYPSELIKAYLNGEFVNLTSGTVYHAFDRNKHKSNETVQPGEPLFIGLDFNVQNMSAVVHVKRESGPVAVDELIGLYDTPAMIEAIKYRYPKHKIYVYPDASGNARKTVDASVSDISLLKGAGFYVMVNKKNPNVRDRITCMNACFEKRGYTVNASKCPIYTRSLEQQSYGKDGKPDKTQGDDHPNDAAGYFITFEYPIVRPVTKLIARSF